MLSFASSFWLTMSSFCCCIWSILGSRPEVWLLKIKPDAILLTPASHGISIISGARLRHELTWPTLLSSSIKENVLHETTHPHTHCRCHVDPSTSSARSCVRPTGVLKWVACTKHNELLTSAMPASIAPALHSCLLDMVNAHY